MQRSFLFANWEGGGNTPPLLSIVRKLLARGHRVRVLSDLCQRPEIEASGASFVSWTQAPSRADKSIETDPFRDWELKSPPALLARLRDQIFVGPAFGYARDVLAELKQFPADVIVTNEMLLGAMAGAEAAGVPCVALSTGIYLYSLPGVPPFGPGLQPRGDLFGRLRDALVRKMTLGVFAKGTKSFNAARRDLGLEPIGHPFEQAERVMRHLVLTSAAFDFPATSLPPYVTYAGPELDDPAWAEPWQSPWTANDRRPLVLVGFSTTYQSQADLLRRVIEALKTLDIRAVVTSGPAISPADLPSAENVFVCRSAPHSELVPQASLVVTHAGHGTVIRSLAAGVPLVCVPMGRDQNDNTARVIARGAGIGLNAKSSIEKIRAGIRDVLETPRYRESAQALGRRITEDVRNSQAIEILEEVAQSRPSKLYARQCA